jgi:folate-dependent phosphoribosylglycinamide formyltransferase PurN
MKKICIITTKKEKLFTPFFLNYITYKYPEDIEIIYIPGFLNLKKIIYVVCMFKFTEIIRSIRLIFFNNIKINKLTKVFEFDSVNNDDFIKFINKKKFKLLVSFNCNQIFKEKTLKKINKNIINFHPGILPKYKGLFTNFYTLKNKEKFAGVSCHKIISKIDSGQLIKRLFIKVEKKDTIFSLYEKIFTFKKSFKFYENCIFQYNLIKNKKIKILDNYSYKSYPDFLDTIKLRFKLK